MRVRAFEYIKLFTHLSLPYFVKVGMKKRIDLYVTTQALHPQHLVSIVCTLTTGSLPNGFFGRCDLFLVLHSSLVEGGEVQLIWFIE